MESRLVPLISVSKHGTDNCRARFLFLSLSAIDEIYSSISFRSTREDVTNLLKVLVVGESYEEKLSVRL